MSETLAKYCPRCKTNKWADDFGKHKGNADGRRRICKACALAEARRDRPLKTAPVHEPASPAPAPEPLPPLEAAEKRYEVSRTTRTLKREHSALFEENQKLKQILAEVRVMERPSDGLLIETPPEPEKGEAVPFILFSDWHVEEEVSLSQMHGVNEYSLDIARDRATKAFTNSLRLMSLFSEESLIRRAVCQLGGDFFSGSIHPELMEINQLRPGDAAHFAKSLLSSGIRYWLENSDLDFHFVCVGGNHGRMTEKTRISTGSGNSLEVFMYRFLAAEFQDEPRVKFTIADGNLLYTRIFPNFVLRSIHGDQVKYGGGVGGLTIPLNKWIYRQDASVKAQLTAMGHFHQQLDGGSWLVNGSIIGPSPYSQWFGFSPEKPQQTFALIHARDGGTKSVVAPIWVTD